MTTDLKSFQTLTVKEQAEEKGRLLKKIDEVQSEFDLIEKRMKTAMKDDTARPSDLAPLLSYREEIRQVLTQLRNLLNQIERLNSDGGPGRTVSSALSTFGAGVVNIRADDTRNRAVPNAKTYQQILDDRFDSEPSGAVVKQVLSKLEDRMEGRLEEFRRAMEAKKTEDVKKQSSTTKTS